MALRGRSGFDDICLVTLKKEFLAGDTLDRSFPSKHSFSSELTTVSVPTQELKDGMVHIFGTGAPKRLITVLTQKSERTPTFTSKPVRFAMILKQIQLTQFFKNFALTTIS